MSKARAKKLITKGDKAFNKNDFDSAMECYQKAMKTVRFFVLWLSSGVNAVEEWSPIVIFTHVRTLNRREGGEQACCGCTV